MKRFIVLTVIASFFQIAISTAPTPYITAAFYALQSRGKTEASGILQRITNADSSTLNQLLHDASVFLGSPAFLVGLSHKYEKPLFEKALAEGLKQLIKGSTAQQQQKIATLTKSFKSSDRPAFITNLTKLGYENPEAFDADYVSPEVLFVKSPTGRRTRYGLTEFLADEATLSPEHRHKHTRHLQEKHARTTATPSPTSSESFYTSSESRSRKPATIFADPLPQTRAASKPGTTSRPQARSRARAAAPVQTKSNHPLPAQERRVRHSLGVGERRRSPSKQRRTPTPPPVPARAASTRGKALDKTPVFAIDLSRDDYENEMPSVDEIRRALDPGQFYTPTKSSRHSSRGTPSPAQDSSWHDFAVSDDFFEVPPPRTSRSSSHASLPSEVGLPSDTESSRSTSPDHTQFTLRDLPPPPPRPVLPLYPDAKGQPAKPASPTRSRRSSSSSSSSRETFRMPPPRTGAGKPLKPAKRRRDQQQLGKLFSQYKDTAADILARSEKALSEARTHVHVPGFVTTAE